MISNSSRPRTNQLMPLNSSPFSRGSRAVHQGQKKAKAYNVCIAEADCDNSFGLLKDEDGGKEMSNGELLIKPLRDSLSPNQNCDPTTYLTPISKGILKSKREAEMAEPDVTCSKKKVIFANPISATKLIESRKSMKISRKRRLRYEDALEEPTEVPTENMENNSNEVKQEQQQEQQQPPQPEPKTIKQTSDEDLLIVHNLLIDPATIIPRATIVIKRLTDAMIIKC